jgi:hypothetical protein
MPNNERELINMIEAKDSKISKQEREIGLETLELAITAGESRVNRLICMAHDVTPAAQGKAIVEELKSLKTLLEAMRVVVKHVN